MTLNDRFKNAAADHCDYVRNNAAASDIIYAWGEREEILDDIVLAMSECEEQCRAERNARTDLDKCLTEADENIWARAVPRSDADRSDKSPPDTTKGKNRRAVGVDLDDREEDITGRHIEEQD